ncbi:hypothetical protein FIBSPDRAFT_964339 [Athelia psychrophila]|uniref:Uncharacterized protein n=1 Tax=Athelia psychrophila TaxID=1759441 RepID=A0A165XX99_9AGAM|nr:hypothetical protein FIBSPDRAFT_964339 [Fibularhizoctonia sp. CBS 109695]
MFARAYIIGGTLVAQLTNPTLYKNLSWSFFSNSATFTHTFNIGISIIHVLLTFIVVIVARSTLTMGLHGCEIITNISSIRAAIKDLVYNPALGLQRWPTIRLLTVKPIERWVLRSIAVGSSWRSPVQFSYLALMGDIYRCHGDPRLPPSRWLAARGVWAPPDTRRPHRLLALETRAYIVGRQTDTDAAIQRSVLCWY